MTWKDEMKFGPPTPKKMRTVLAQVSVHGVRVAGQAIRRAVEDEVFRLLVEHLLVAEVDVPAVPYGSSV